MLAKMWKKVLLAICIVACIFNIMSKLVNRHSLESNLERVNDGNTVLDAIRTEENVIETENIIEEAEEYNNVYSEEENTQSTEQEEVQESEKNFSQDESENRKSNTHKYTDYTIIF